MAPSAEEARKRRDEAWLVGGAATAAADGGGGGGEEEEDEIEPAARPQQQQQGPRRRNRNRPRPTTFSPAEIVQLVVAREAERQRQRHAAWFEAEGATVTPPGGGPPVRTPPEVQARLAMIWQRFGPPALPPGLAAAIAVMERETGL